MDHEKEVTAGVHNATGGDNMPPRFTKPDNMHPTVAKPAGNMMRLKCPAEGKTVKMDVNEKTFRACQVVALGQLISVSGILIVVPINIFLI